MRLVSNHTRHVLAPAAFFTAFTVFSFWNSASASTCPAYTYTPTNGTTADASQVTANFNTIMSCANTLLAPLASPSFTGKVGIGASSPTYSLDVQNGGVSGAMANFGAASGSGANNFILIDSGRAMFGYDGTSVNLVLNAGNGKGMAFYVNGSNGGFLTGTNAMVITSSGQVGIGTTSPGDPLEVNGMVKIDSFASASSTAVCENAGVLSSCSSSIRYKENVKSATFGLNEVEKLRPVTFRWKGRDERDLGLIAEEVAQIDPLLVTYKNGKIEGVKYAQLTVVLINALKKLKATSDAQATQIAALQADMKGLRRIRRLRTAMLARP